MTKQSYKQQESDARPMQADGTREELNAELFQAVLDRDGAAVLKALESGAQIDAQHEKGFTVLNMAVNSGYSDMAVLLIENGAAVNQSDPLGWTMLQNAARKGDAKVVDALVAKNVDLDAQTRKYGESALNIAVQKGFEGIAVTLLRAGANPNIVARDQKQSLIMMAIEQCKEILMRDLVKYGANLTARNPQGETALDMALSRGKKDLAEMIVERISAQNEKKIKSAFMRRRRGGAAPS